MLRRLLPLLVALAFAAPALAADDDSLPLDVCNKSSYAADVAIGLEVSTGAATQGWFRVLPGECREMLQEGVGAKRHLLNVRPLALYGTPPETEHGAIRLCVREEDFLIAGATECAREGQFMADFVPVDPVTVDGRRQVAIDEPSDFDLGQARIAGLQRLLGLAGYDAGTIDGVEGARTGSAIATFAQDANVDEGDLAAVTTALIDRIASGQVDAVPKFCNETLNPVMFAIGVPLGEGIETRGWYQVSPGNCARPLATTLSGQKLYVFAEAVDRAGAAILAHGQPVAWSGKTMLCTKNLEFRIRGHKNCEARGMSSRGFAEFTVPGDGALIVPFRDQDND